MDARPWGEASTLRRLAASAFPELRSPQAVLLLFPITAAYEKLRKEKDAQIEEDGVEGVEDIIYFKQTSELLFSPLVLMSCS